MRGHVGTPIGICSFVTQEYSDVLDANRACRTDDDDLSGCFDCGGSDCESAPRCVENLCTEVVV